MIQHDHNALQAAVEIQRHVRGKQVRQSMSKLSTAALVIQARWRCHQAAANFCALRQAVIRLQSQVRGTSVRRQQARLHVAALMIQVQMFAFTIQQCDHQHVIPVEKSVKQIDCVLLC